MQINTITKKWGNSIGVIIPSEVIKKQEIKEGQEIIITMVSKKKTKVKNVFGKLKFKKDTQEILDEIDEDLEPKRFN